MRTRTPDEVAAVENPVIVDVREPDELTAIRVPGAISIPLSSFEERIGELPSGELNILCHSGARSARVTRYLDEHGYDAVNIEGGIVAWSGAGLPTESD